MFKFGVILHYLEQSNARGRCIGKHSTEYDLLEASGVDSELFQFHRFQELQKILVHYEIHQLMRN